MKRYLKITYAFLLAVLLSAFLITCGGSGGGTATYYEDSDGDGYGNSDVSITSGEQPEGYVTDNTDCDDKDSLIYPDADEIPDDEIDQDCDGYDGHIYYADKDADGYGDPEDSIVASSQPSEYVINDKDCNDTDNNINPSVDETAGDGIDNNCNDIIDEIQVPQHYYSIQKAIDAAQDGDTVIVDNGRYTENIDFKGKAITVKSANGAENTIIDGYKNGSVVTFNEGETTTTVSVLDGFTITNGIGTIIEQGRPDGGVDYLAYGGGIYCKTGAPTIINCIITGNSVNLRGGGIHIETLAAAKIINCTISDNSSDLDGGGICSYASSGAAIINCKITRNSARMGGGVYVDGSTHIPGFDYFPIIINSTIIGNSADEGGGIHCSHFTSPTVVNSILWENTNGIGGNDEIYLFYIPDYLGKASIDITYSNIQCGWEGEGNIDTDPLFADDYHLTTGSFCINAGIDTYIYNNENIIPTDDIDGDKRPQGAGIDMGADEYTE